VNSTKERVQAQVEEKEGRSNLFLGKSWSTQKVILEFIYEPLLAKFPKESVAHMTRSSLPAVLLPAYVLIQCTILPTKIPPGWSASVSSHNTSSFLSSPATSTIALINAALHMSNFFSSPASTPDEDHSGG
jgi:hypothetical protein